MTTKAETNARIGRLYYNALTDAAGYPNGYAYWEDMTPAMKYNETLTALGFVRMLEEQGMVTTLEPMGTGNSHYDEGECKELMDHFIATHAAERAELEARIAHFNTVLGAVKSAEIQHGEVTDEPEEH